MKRIEYFVSMQKVITESEDFECSDCKRNIANRLTKGGLYSAALFKDTDMCPHKGENDER